MMSQCRPALTTLRRVHLSKERQITTAMPRAGGPTPPGSTPPPDAVVPTYLGYLSKVIQSSISQGAQALGLTAAEQKSTVVQSKTPSTAAQVKVVTDRTIKRMESRTEVTNKTVALVRRVLAADSISASLYRVQQLNDHIITYPATRLVAAQDSSLISKLIDYERADTDVNMKAAARMCLTLCGYQPNVKSRGINLLAIDGGGTRGMMGLAVLAEIERLTGKRVCELFDLVTGVSTGGIIATLLGVKRFSVAESKAIYMEISKKLFFQNKVQGAVGLLRSHSYYDTSKWISLLKELIGEHDTLIESCKSKHVPRIGIVASIVNLPKVEPYIFRNYEHPAGRDSHYRGGVSHPLWQAIQASAAAPFYFEEVELPQLGILLQDGGVYANNPTSIAVHEAKLLWPNEELHCVVSTGNGRSVVELAPPLTVKSTGLQDKLNRIIDSATDTEAVHNTLRDTLDHRCYYRLNPYMSYPYPLDEVDPSRLEQMQHDAMLYVRRNHSKIEMAAERLMERPTFVQDAQRKWKTFRDSQPYFKQQ